MRDKIVYIYEMPTGPNPEDAKVTKSYMKCILQDFNSSHNNHDLSVEFNYERVDHELFENGHEMYPYSYQDAIEVLTQDFEEFNLSYEEARRVARKAVRAAKVDGRLQYQKKYFDGYDAVIPPLKR